MLYDFEQILHDVVANHTELTRFLVISGPWALQIAALLGTSHPNCGFYYSKVRFFWGGARSPRKDARRPQGGVATARDAQTTYPRSFLAYRLPDGGAQQRWKTARELFVASGQGRARMCFRISCLI